MNKNQKSIRRVARATRNNEGVTEMSVGNRTIAIRRRPPVKRAACKVAGPNARRVGEQLRLQKEMAETAERERAYRASRRHRYE